jgi:hypothetical protein
MFYSILNSSLDTAGMHLKKIHVEIKELFKVAVLGGSFCKQACMRTHTITHEHTMHYIYLCMGHYCTSITH